MRRVPSIASAVALALISTRLLGADPVGGSAPVPSPRAPPPPLVPTASASPAPAPPPGAPSPYGTDTSTSASPLVAPDGPAYERPPEASAPGAAPPGGAAAAAPAGQRPPEVNDDDDARGAFPSDSLDTPHFALGGGGHVAFGTAPAVAVGFRVSGEVATGRWSLGIEGRYDLPSGKDNVLGVHVSSTLVGGSFVPCLRAKGTWACGVVLLSRLGVEGAEAGGPTVRDARFFLGLGGRLEAHFAMPLHFALRIGGELLTHPIPIEVGPSERRLFKSSVVSATLGPTLVRAF